MSGSGDEGERITLKLLLGQGHSVEEIQKRLSLNRKTIETYRRRTKEKMGLDTVSELLHYAVQWTCGQGTDQEDEGLAPQPSSVEG